MSGKGDKPRHDIRKYGAGYDAIKWRKPVSNCCGASMRIEGRTTMWYVCEKCGNPCDATKEQK